MANYYNIIKKWHKLNKIKINCPYCLFEQKQLGLRLQTDRTFDGGCIKYVCEACNKTFYIEELIKRTYITGDGLESLASKIKNFIRKNN